MTSAPPLLTPSMTLADFTGRHAGEIAWLFGKGPSLSTFDFTTAGPLRLAINDVFAHVPACVYAVSCDSVQPWADLFRSGITLFQAERAHALDRQHLGPVSEVVPFAGDGDPSCLALPPRDLAACLATARGSLGAALQILHIMGVRDVHLVGIDGGGVHAPGYRFRTQLSAHHRIDYTEIRDDAIRLAGLLNMALTFHTLDSMTTDGKVHVRITRACFAEGIAYEAGAVIATHPRAARDLIAAEAAVILPAAPTRETAAAAPAAETAALPKPTAKKTTGKSAE